MYVCVIFSDKPPLQAFPIILFSILNLQSSKLSGNRLQTNKFPHSLGVKYYDVASDVGVNFKNVGVLSIESFLFHVFHYTFLQTKHQRKGY